MTCVCTGPFDAWQKIRAGQHGGYLGFARRSVMRIVRPAPIIGLQLAMYEQARGWFRGVSELKRERDAANLLPPAGPLETRERRYDPNAPPAPPAPVATSIRSTEPITPYFAEVERQPAITPSSREHLQWLFYELPEDDLK